MKENNIILSEPYRLCFPLGIIFLLWGILIWLPMLWGSGEYPVLLHRYLVVNGFTGLFIGGFLMTAVPRFSQTFFARSFEVGAFLFITLLGLLFSYQGNEKLMFIASGIQPLILLFFIFSRILKRKQNPPYSFVFIFVGLILWSFSAMGSAFFGSEMFAHIHHEGAIAAIILGVGGRLIPGILGHVDIVKFQREQYEKPVSVLTTVPWHFWIIIISFVASYFINEQIGHWVRVVAVLVVALFYWRLYQAPTQRTALTWSIWTSSWLITLSFVLKASWIEGIIHASHSFFINGIVLLCLLIATRVIVSHGPKDNNLENSKVLYVVTFLVFLASATRVTAFLMPEHYLRHLAYASIVLSLALVLWGAKYLRYLRR